MADNVTFTTPSFVAATDEVSGTLEHVQLMKLAISTDGSRTLIPADATNGIDVDVTRVSGQVTVGDGTNAIGILTSTADGSADGANMQRTTARLMGFNGTTWDRVRGDTNGLWANVRKSQSRIQVAVSGVTTATTAYTAGDQVGTIISLTNAARATGGTGRVTSVILQDRSDIVGAYDVLFFRNSITLAGDNAVFAISDADSLECVGIAQLAGSFDIGNNRLCQAFNLSIPYDTGSGTTLYAVLLCRVGHTFFASGSEPYLTVTVERD